ncbi:MAG: NADPH-quinone reductase [Fusobacteria bacterium]|nr:MAG: NADPH-quinone reductase [Fusobacteriota bacterium]KAF0228595.1 MAG: NADPH-quinone [Fusobacteriota bacterium]
MKFLIIDSHPYSESFNRQLTRKIEEVVKEKHEVEMLNLVDDGFNPVMDTASLKLFSTGKSADLKVEEYQKKINEADCLVFAFPIWWSTMPAILKGFLDKVFLYGYAYISGENGALEGLFSKQAVVITTMETPNSVYNEMLNNPVKNHFINATLATCGIQTLKHFQIDKINSGTDDYRKDSFNQIVEYFKKL